MSWIAVDTGLPNHAKVAELPSDAARWGWLVTLCEAKDQRKPGIFASERHYRHVMARHGKFLPDYISAGLLDKNEDGSIVVHDWQRHQWAAVKAAQRETSHGSDEDIPRTSRGQKEDASRAVPVPVYVSSTEKKERARLSPSERSALVVACSECQADAGSPCRGVREERNGEPWERWAVHRPRWEMSRAVEADEEPDAAVAFRDRTGEFPSGKILSWINELSKAHGERRLTEMIAATPKTGTVVEYLRSVRDALRAQDHKAERAEKADEERRLTSQRAALRALPPANDISEAEAKRLAAEYVAEVRR